MNVLDRLFASPESVSQRAEYDAGMIRKSWEDYLATVPEKKNILDKLHGFDHDRMGLIIALRKMLDLELLDLSRIQDDEGDLISSIRYLSKDERLVRIKKLESCLRYAETRYDYVFELLRHLAACLQEEAHVATMCISKKLSNYQESIDKLGFELILEETILNKVGDMGAFHDLFASLVKGEHIVKVMNDKERGLHKLMKEEFQSILGGKRIDWLSHRIKEPSREAQMYDTWLISVFNALEDKFRELEADGILANHPDAHLELVNRPEFVDLSRSMASQLSVKQDEESVTVFVRIFREWYNHELH